MRPQRKTARDAVSDGDWPAVTALPDHRQADLSSHRK